MGTTTISLSDEAYRILKAQKLEEESFSDLILRKFGKGNPSVIHYWRQRSLHLKHLSCKQTGSTNEE
ncbi:MAG: antitoxin VapB family protein [Candidatus Nitrosotenuis sp.]